MTDSTTRPQDFGERLADLAARSASETRSLVSLTPRHFGIHVPATGSPLQHHSSFLSVEGSSSFPQSSYTATSLPMNTRSKPSTPRPLTGDSSNGSSGQQASPEMGRPLNVTDALSYLDAVKMQFQDKPEVYNQFLDIMKDFKSQEIDTPGVIQRVSKLFHGNPYLIQGFNTFLPVGYRIDISADPMDPNMITVTTPLGTTTQSTNAPSIISSRRDMQFAPAHNLPLHYPGQQAFDPPFSPSLQNPQTTAAASFLGNLNNRSTTIEKQTAGEFNHAIQYLNKIKARYSDDPNTYKQFLDILQAYQKEQSATMSHESKSQVYVQVQRLFQDAPDLLAEFKDFLPDVAGVPGQNGVMILPHPPQGTAATWSQTDVTVSSPAAVPAKKPTQASKRKKRVVEKDPTPVPPAKVAPSRTKKIKHNHNHEPGSPNFSPYVGPSSPQLPQAHPFNLGQSSSQYSQGSQSLPHGMGAPVNASGDRLLFFDRAKKSLENREVYEEFLKLISLFSKEIIDLKILIERARVFLGDGDLMAEFKDLLGWDDRQEDVENGPPGSIRTGPPEALSALPADDGEGPSYRKLPESEIRLTCSGRDELCRSVLNDEWVSHPTWASEEAVFVAHKKNSFEEALHKSEEERYEYHVHLEALTRTIAILEQLNTRLEEMTNDERAMFKLKPDLGGSAKAIYHRSIKRVYGRDSGLEVIQALQDCPGIAVPVVLARLKQKDEEWRRAQREWSRTWREVDSKNFYKSLDHQGISFKQNDKKNITAKYFVADIEYSKNKQLGAWEKEGIHSFAQGSVGHQLEYAFHDTPVLLDSLKMVYSFLDRSQVQYSPQERRSVEKFLRAFIPLLCMYPAAEFNAACGPIEGIHDDDPVHELNGYADVLRSGRRSTGSTHSGLSIGIPADDLRKKLLRTAQEKNTRDSKVPSTATSRAASPFCDRRTVLATREGGGEPEDIWIKESYSDAKPTVTDKGRPFFANTTFYTLLRLLQLLYSRLVMCKEIGSQLAEQKYAPLLANRVAVELGLDDPNGPSAVLSQTIEVLGDRGAGEGANVVYMYLLNACEKLFDSDLDQATFEEHMRWFFGNKAYQLFTLDKLIAALVKQVQTILSDNKCQELWTLLQGAQNAETITNQDITRYRREAERHVGVDDHLYRIQWIRETKCIRVSLTGPDEPSVETDGRSVSRWREYVNTYVMTHPTEWVPTKTRGGPVFIRRSVRTEGSSTAPKTLWENRMKIRIHRPTYKLVYEEGSEEIILNIRGKEEEDMLWERARARQEERRRWIYK